MKKIFAFIPGVLASLVALVSQHFFCCILPKIWPGGVAAIMSAFGLAHDDVSLLLVSFGLTLLIYSLHFAWHEWRIAKKQAQETALDCTCPQTCYTTQTRQPLWLRYITNIELLYSLGFAALVNVVVWLI